MRLLLLPVAVYASLLAAGPVSAAFTETADAATGTLAGDVLSGPAVLAAPTATCQGGLFGLLGGTPVVGLTWTPSPALATSTASLRGQSVSVVVASQSRTALTTSAVTASTAAATVTGYVDGSGVQRPLSSLTSYTFEVRTLWGAWSSPATTTSGTTGLC